MWYCRERNVPRSQPEQGDRVELVGVGDQQQREHEEEKDVSKDEVGSEHAQFTDLAKELTTRLRNGVPAHGVPLSSPPRDVGGVRLELTSESQGDD